MKSFLLLFLLLSFLPFSPLRAQESAGRFQQADTMLAIVGNEVITMVDVLRQTFREEQQLRRQSSLSPQEFSGELLKLRTAALESLIEQELVYLEFQRLKAQLPLYHIQNRVNQIIQEETQGNLPKFEAELYKQGMTMAKFRERLYRQMAVEVLIREKTRKGNHVADSEVKKYYEENRQKMFSSPRRVRIAVIQLKNDGRYAEKLEETVREIYGKLAVGTPFADLAREYSEGSNAQNGGDQGTVSGLAPKLEEAVAKLRPGETAEKPITLGSSQYILRLLEFSPEKILPLTEERMAEIRETLEKREAERRYAAFIRELYVRFPVTRIDTSVQ